MKPLLILILSLCFSLRVFGQDSISHLNCKGKASEIHKLIQGNWVCIQNPNLKLSVTNKEIKLSSGFRNKEDTNFVKYTLAYLDSSESSIRIDIDFGGWEGYLIMSDDFVPLRQITSISNKYLILEDTYFKKIK